MFMYTRNYREVDLGKRGVKFFSKSYVGKYIFSTVHSDAIVRLDYYTDHRQSCTGITVYLQSLIVFSL